jgi:hypothetical protein
MEYDGVTLKEASSGAHGIVTKWLEQGWTIDETIPVGKNTVVIFKRKKPAA